MSPKREARALLAVSFFLTVGAALMVAAPLSMGDVTPACVYSAPILCAELAESGSQLRQILEGPSSAGLWRYHLFVDLPYLVLYGTLFAVPFARERRGLLPSIAVFVAAVCDVIENVALLRGLDGVYTDTVASVARTMAHTKFFLLALGVAAGLIVIAGTNRGPARIAYCALALVVAIGLVGPLWPPALELGFLALLPAGITLTVRAARRARRP